MLNVFESAGAENRILRAQFLWKSGTAMLYITYKKILGY